MDKGILLLTAVVACFIMVIYYATRKHRLSSILYGSMTGLIALVMLSHFGEGFGLDLRMNMFNCCGSALLGVPFVICEVILKIL
ncbi:MAG: hypothetical protein GXY08_01995 [Ruminococcus sp.]|nr:hypothetical protein [Ruminococcus sp.]